MNIWLQWILIGLGSGLVLVPAGLGIISLFKTTIARRKIKMMLKKGQFLRTIDPKDYDSNTWKNEINIEQGKKDMEQLNLRIFKDGKPKNNSQ